MLSYEWTDNLGLTIRLDDAVVCRPRQTRCIFWNAGTETIERSHLVSGDPLKFGNDGVQILKVVLFEPSKAILSATYNLDADKNYVIIDFDFLEPNDGIVIDILFDSEAESPRDPTLSGTIKGMRGGPTLVFGAHRRPAWWTYLTGLLVSAGLIMTGVVLAVDAFQGSFTTVFTFAKWIGSVFSLILGLIAFALTLETLFDRKTPVPDLLRDKLPLYVDRRLFEIRSQTEA